MEGTHRKPAKRAAEPIDEWLQSQGFFRKHAPKDPTCLFRAVSEQIYSTQHFHIRVRSECVDFMKKHSNLFQEKVAIPLDNYLDQMACFTEWGGINEIEAMSDLYNRQIIIFDGHTLTQKVVNNNDYENHILLCFTAQKQYESVYTQEYIQSAAFCQSLVYKTLYKDVFKMLNVDETVHKMLHDRSPSFKNGKLFSKGNMENRDLSSDLLSKMEEGCTDIEDKLIHKGGLTPFPYRVAKALDEDIYRNTDFDIWHEIRREVRNSGFSKYNGTEFQVGGKCLIELNAKEDDLANNNDLGITDKKTGINSEESSASGNDPGKLLTGHIQEMSKNEGPVVVFILELGEKRTVPYSALRPIITPKKTKSSAITTLKKNPAIEQTPKFKKSFGPSTRKGKEQVAVGCPSFERNSNKGTPIKKNSDNTMKWADESSESSNATFGKQCTENYSLPAEDFTADLDFSEEREKNATLASLTNEENLEKVCSSSSAPACGSENNFQPPQQNATYFLPPTVFPYCGNDMLPNVGYLLDQMVQPINLALSKSTDANASDLPLSDLQSMRFFYNLGIEYYRATNWLCGSNQPPPTIVNGQCFAMENSTGQKPSNIPGSHPEDVTQMANKYTYRSKKENGENRVNRGPSNQKALKNSNIRFNGIQEPPMQNNNSPRNVKDCNKNVQYYNNERSREHINGPRDVQRNSRNGVAPRFKKCDGQSRNFAAQPSRRIHQRDAEFHQGNNRFLGSKMEGPGKQSERNGGVPGNRQNQFHHQGQMPSVNNFPYQYAANQPPPLYPPPMCNEAETYCTQNPGLIPIPYVHQVADSGDNNANPFAPVVYTGIDNYPQTYVPYYPPYAYPPQTAVYPGIAPTNAQENWYQYPGHSHYISSCVQFNPPPGTPPNGGVM